MKIDEVRGLTADQLTESLLSLKKKIAMPKRSLEGLVVSDKGDKTVIVKVERTFLHPLLKKTVRRSKKYHAHDEANLDRAGEFARIVECAPKSKLKTWEVLPKGDSSVST